MQIFKTPNFDFIRWRWHAIAFSALIIAAGIGKIAMSGLPLGIDFTGGSAVVEVDSAVRRCGG
jgi:preprotein translocase subunit SecF